MELFDRTAYYGMNALLDRYLTDQTDGSLGFAENEAGLLQSIVYAASAAYCGAMLQTTLTLYTDPPRPKSTKTLGDVLRNALLVLSDARFMLLVFVYSCFWILYFQNFGTMLWYLRDFVDPALANAILAPLGMAFDAEFVTIVSAGTIVALQLPVGFVVKKLPALPTMIAGVAIGACGFLFLSASSRVGVFVLGIAVFALGEMTCHPKYYAYIGMVSPAEHKATYMGHAFLYGVIGSLVGSNLGGELYASVLRPIVGQASAPATARGFGLGFAATGFWPACALLAFDRLFGKGTEASRRLARRTMTFIYGALLLGAPAMLAFVARHSLAGVSEKTWIQCSIMLLLGVFGLWTLSRRSDREAVS